MAAAFQNVLDPEYTRYIDVGDDLWAYLDEKYRSLVGPDYDYRVTVGSSRPPTLPPPPEPGQSAPQKNSCRRSTSTIVGAFRPPRSSPRYVGALDAVFDIRPKRISLLTNWAISRNNCGM